jgi:hypothetical protein
MVVQMNKRQYQARKREVTAEMRACVNGEIWEYTPGSKASMGEKRRRRR